MSWAELDVDICERAVARKRLRRGYGMSEEGDEARGG